MGALIPIGGGADAEIKLRLNTAFNDTNIVIIRGLVAKEDLFDSHHHLHRIAYRLGTYPTGTYSGDDAKGKWFYFLKTTLNGSATNSIKSVLSYALNTQAVKRVVFDAIQGTDGNPDHYVAPGNPVHPNDIAPLVDSTGTLTVTLVCPSPLANTSAPTPDQQGDLDRDPHGNIIEKRPIKIFLPKNLAPPVLSKATRQPIKPKAKTPTRGKKGKKTKAKKRK